MNEKIKLDNLFIEVTKICNSKCAHCMRGIPRKEKFTNVEYLENLLCNIEEINQVTFTGGEPSFNPEIINDFLLIAKKYNINLHSFGVFTNGLIYSQELVKNLYKLYTFSTEKDKCVLSVSVDPFHKFNKENYEKYKKLVFYKGIKEINLEKNNIPLIKTGRAKNNKINPTVEKAITFKDKKIEKINDTFYVYYKIYVECNGKIHNECNISYDEMDSNNFYIGDLNKNNFLDIIKRSYNNDKC